MMSGCIGLPVKSPSSRSTTRDSASYSATQSARYLPTLIRTGLSRQVPGKSETFDPGADEVGKLGIVQAPCHTFTQPLG